MELNENFVNNLYQSQSVFDIVGVCYCELLKYIDDSNVRFVVRTTRMAEKEGYSETAQPYENLRQIILNLAFQIDANEEHDGIGFSEFRAKLFRELSAFLCPEPMDISFPVCIFYVLEALDSYTERNQTDIRESYRTLGPLNKGNSRSSCLVYFQENESFLSNAYDTEDRSGFRKPFRPARIGSIFRSFLLVPCNQLPCIPIIKPISIPKNSCCEKDIIRNKRFRIASIPFIGFDTFCFHEKDKAECCKPNVSPKDEFYVEYLFELEADNIQLAIDLLDLAIKKEANIIIFPEFIMSDGMRTGISNYLKKLSPANREHLLLVIAGTTYQWDGVSEGNNILYMFNSRGNVIGKYYKFSPFREESEDRFHGADLVSQKSSKPKYFANCEILSNPGKECTLVDISGIGRMLPAICRDVIDGYTENLAKIFMPSLILTPAWSRSVASFDVGFRALAGKFHTMALLCNCCNAVRGCGAKNIGKLYIPEKRGTGMDAKIQPIAREMCCTSLCKNRGGCMIQIDIDFSGKQPTGEIRRDSFHNDKTSLLQKGLS